MLANVGCNDLPVLGAGVGQDVLNQIVAILVAGNIDERNARAIDSTLTNTIQVPAQKVRTADFQALLNHLGRKLVHAVFSSKANDMVNGTTAVTRGTVLTDMLNAPVSELAVGDDVDVRKNLLDARALDLLADGNMLHAKSDNCLPCPLPDSSQRCSAPQDFQSLPERPHATCRTAHR